MAFALGTQPEKLTIQLSPRSDFVAVIQRSDGQDWAAGTEVFLEFETTTDPISWPATISGTDASWNVDEADVDTLIATRPRKARLWYVEGEVRLLWAAGGVKVAS